VAGTKIVLRNPRRQKVTLIMLHVRLNHIVIFYCDVSGIVKCVHSPLVSNNTS
jgi:hypothetical protein